MPDLRAQAEEPSLRVECSFDLVALLASVVRGDEVLSAILGPLHRPPELVREVSDEEVLGKEVAAYAEAPARIGRSVVDLVERETEQTREHTTVVMGHERGAPDRHPLAPRVVVRDQTSRFHRDSGVTTRNELGGYDMGGIGECRLDV